MGKETGASASDTDLKMAGGAILDMAPNERVDFADPSRPNTSFDAFVMSILRQVGVRLGIPYEVLVMHFTASYSAARAALLQAWKFFFVRRAWLATKFCQPIYETFLAEAIASGRLVAPGFFRDPLRRMAWCGAEWQGDGPGSIDPAKEVTAVEKRLALNLTTLQTETAAYDGRDWEANVVQAGREREKRKKAGVLVETVPAAASPEEPPADQPEQD
jgi:capsid protein